MGNEIPTPPSHKEIVKLSDYYEPRKLILVVNIFQNKDNTKDSRFHLAATDDLTLNKTQNTERDA